MSLTAGGLLVRADEDVWTTQELVMGIDSITTHYMSFCFAFEYYLQARFKDLAQMEDVCVLAAVRMLGPLSEMHTIPAGRSYDKHELQFMREELLRRWPMRQNESKRLFKHLFHAREGLIVMDEGSLARAKAYFDKRAYEVSTDSMYKPGITLPDN